MRLNNHQKAGKRIAKLIKRRDPSFYIRIGAEGGKKSRGGGFTKDNREHASLCGKIGGKMNKGKTRGAYKKKQVA